MFWKINITVDSRYCGHPFVFIIARVRNSGVRDKKIVLSVNISNNRQLRKHKVSNVASRTGKRSGRQQEKLIFAPNWRMVSLFSFIVMSLYIMRVGILDEVSATRREKDKWNFVLGIWKCPHFRNSERLKWSWSTTVIQENFQDIL